MNEIVIIRTFRKPGILKITFLLLQTIVFAQDTTRLESREKINLAIGAGISEGINLNARYQFGQMQLGLGITPPVIPDYLAISSSFYAHLLGKSRLTKRKPWFIKLGFSFSRSDNKRSIAPVIWHDMWANFYLGRDINLSRRLGFSYAMGTISRFYSKSISEQKQLDNTFFSIGGGELNIYYRLLYK